MTQFAEAVADHRSAVHVVSVRMRDEEMGWVKAMATEHKVAKGEVIRQALRLARQESKKA